MKISQLPNLVMHPVNIRPVRDLPSALFAFQPNRVRPEKPMFFIIEVQVAPPRREEVLPELPRDFFPFRKQIERFLGAVEVAQVVYVVAIFVA